MSKWNLGRHDYRVDVPTLGLAIAIYAAFALLTWNYHFLPAWLVLPAGASLVCLHGSLQHEAVHRYPFRSLRLNRWLVGWPLWLWLPYDIYRRSHLKHHIDENLTDPVLDPESNYLASEQWSRLPPPLRLLRRAMATVAGRVLIGPAYFTARVWRDFAIALRRRDRRQLRPWLWHVGTMAVLLFWIVGVCGIPLWAYIACFAWPGTSMTLLRSYAEHRAHPEAGKRSLMLEAGWFWSLMFLNNNLHALHHAEPGLAWYKRPGAFRGRKAEWLDRNGGYAMPGYGWLAGRYLLRAKEPLIHPGMSAGA